MYIYVTHHLISNRNGCFFVQLIRILAFRFNLLKRDIFKLLLIKHVGSVINNRKDVIAAIFVKLILILDANSVSVSDSNLSIFLGLIIANKEVIQSERGRFAYKSIFVTKSTIDWLLNPLNSDSFKAEQDFDKEVDVIIRRQNCSIRDSLVVKVQVLDYSFGLVWFVWLLHND